MPDLTEEERVKWERQWSEAKLRCKEVWGTLQQLNDMVHSYYHIHDRWRERFEEADRKLAEERVIHCKVSSKSKPSKLSKEELKELLANLDDMI